MFKRHWAMTKMISVALLFLPALGLALQSEWKQLHASYVYSPYRDTCNMDEYILRYSYSTVSYSTRACMLTLSVYEICANSCWDLWSGCTYTHDKKATELFCRL